MHKGQDQVNIVEVYHYSAIAYFVYIRGEIEQRHIRFREDKAICLEQY